MTVYKKLSEHIERYFQTPREFPVTVQVAPDEVRAHLRARYNFQGSEPLADVLDDVSRLLAKWTEHGNHPMHFGLFRPAVDPAAVVADTLVSLYDPNLATWDFSPAANEMERHVLSVLARHFDWDLERDAIAHFTSGGQEANHTAVAVALTSQLPAVAREGLRGLDAQPVFYVSEEGHHSFDKLAHSSGLGRDAVRFVPTGDDLRIDMDTLEDRIRADRERGFLPFLIVGTAGTTSAGVVDPLPELSGLAQTHGLWFHVDAAWGGACALSDKLKPFVAGIERADSITWDAHKWLSVPVGAGMFFCRHRDAVESTFTTETPYVPEQHDDRVYPFMTSMQWSRRFMGLKLFMMLAQHGLEGITDRIERQTAVGHYLRQRLEGAEFRILNDTPLPVVCFTHDAVESGRLTTADVVSDLRRQQAAWISRTFLGRRRVPALRACIANFATCESDIDELVRALDESVRRLPERPIRR